MTTFDVAIIIFDVVLVVVQICIAAHSTWWV
jgi:hypothetical protein